MSYHRRIVRALLASVVLLGHVGQSVASPSVEPSPPADSDDLVRLSAVQALAKLGGPEAVEPLTQALRADAEFLVRHEALVSLAELRNDRVGDALLQALEDPEELIRDKAAEILQLQSAWGREP